MKIINIPLRYKPLEKDINGIIYKEEDIHLATSEDRILELIKRDQLKLYMGGSAGEFLEFDGRGATVNHISSDFVVGTIKQISDYYLRVAVRDSVYNTILELINNGFRVYIVYLADIITEGDKKYAKNIRILHYSLDYDKNIYDKKKKAQNTKCECKVVKELDCDGIRFGIGDKVAVLYDTLGQPKEYICEIIRINRKSFVGKYVNENNKPTDIKFDVGNILRILRILENNRRIV